MDRYRLMSCMDHNIDLGEGMSSYVYRGTAESIFNRDEENLTSSETVLDNYQPAEGSGLTGVSAVSLADPWFESVDFIGAVGETDWTAGWTVGL